MASATMFTQNERTHMGRVTRAEGDSMAIESASQSTLR